MELNNMTITNTNTLHGIYAGGLAARGAIISVGAPTPQTRSTGSAVNITVNSGSYTSIYGGGWAESGASVNVYGVTISVTGGEIADLYGGGNNDQSGARTNVVGDVLISISGGTIGNVHAGAKFVTSKVTGSSTVQINGAAEIGTLCGLSNNGYDGISGTQTLDVNEALSCNSISGFDIIDIASGIEVVLGASEEVNASFDFTGVIIKLGAYTGDEDWTVMTADTLSGLEEAKEVWFGNTKLEDNGGVWSDGNYSLTVTEDSKLVFGKLANA